MKIIKKQHNYREMVWMLAKTDFKLRYHGSFLGFIWVILKPLIQFAVLNFVFSHIFQGGRDFSLGLFTGIILWGFFSEGTMVGMTSLLSKSHIITKIAIPKWIIVVSSTMNTLLNFILNIIVLMIFFIANGLVPSFFSLGIFVYYSFLIYVLVVGFSFFTAPFFLKIRDLNQIWEVIIMAGFYAAPIIYPITIIPESIRFWLYLNPMTFPIVHVKNALLYNQYLFPLHHLFYFLIVFAILIAGYSIFIFTSKRSAEHV